VADEVRLDRREERLAIARLAVTSWLRIVRIITVTGAAGVRCDGLTTPAPIPSNCPAAFPTTRRLSRRRLIWVTSQAPVRNHLSPVRTWQYVGDIAEVCHAT